MARFIEYGSPDAFLTISFCFPFYNPRRVRTLLLYRQLARSSYDRSNVSEHAFRRVLYNFTKKPRTTAHGHYSIISHRRRQMAFLFFVFNFFHGRVYSLRAVSRRERGRDEHEKQSIVYVACIQCNVTSRSVYEIHYCVTLTKDTFLFLFSRPTATRRALVYVYNIYTYIMI